MARRRNSLDRLRSAAGAIADGAVVISELRVLVGGTAPALRVHVLGRNCARSQRRDDRGEEADAVAEAGIGHVHPVGGELRPAVV